MYKQIGFCVCFFILSILIVACPSSSKNKKKGESNKDNIEKAEGIEDNTNSEVALTHLPTCTKEITILDPNDNCRAKTVSIPISCKPGSTIHTVTSGEPPGFMSFGFGSNSSPYIQSTNAFSQSTPTITLDQNCINTVNEDGKVILNTNFSIVVPCENIPHEEEFDETSVGFSKLDFKLFSNNPEEENDFNIEVNKIKLDPNPNRQFKPIPVPDWHSFTLQSTDYIKICIKDTARCAAVLNVTFYYTPNYQPRLIGQSGIDHYLVFFLKEHDPDYHEIDDEGNELYSEDLLLHVLDSLCPFDEYGTYDISDGGTLDFYRCLKSKSHHLAEHVAIVKLPYLCPISAPSPGSEDVNNSNKGH